MKILAIDTSGTNCSVSITEDSKILSDFTINNGVTHSQNLVPMIEQAQKFAGLELTDIDTFACSIGPGSFTGLRIGIATIKGFALSLNKPVIGVPTLLALAYNITNFSGLICSIIDAKNDNVYSAIYRSEASSDLNEEQADDCTTINNNERKDLSNAENIYSANTITQVSDYVSDNIHVLINELKNFEEDIIFVGDGVNTYKNLLLQELSADSYNISFAPEHLNCQYASSVARAALDLAKNNNYCDYNSLSPLYLKKSQAERELGKRKD